MEHPAPGVLRPREGAPFRILQITDTHADVDEYANQRTRADIQAMIAQFRPDLLAVTGDIWCGDAHPDAAPMWMHRELAFFGSLGLPWALAWGNHDYTGDMPATLARIAATPNAVASAGDGSGAFRIEILAPKEDRPCWDLFFLNSGASWRLPEDLAWLDAESRRIATERGRVLPAIAYFHIPTRNYQDAIDQGRSIGFGDEEVLHWGDDEGLAAPLLKAPGNLRACFCGHSHKNDFYFEEEGLVFAYGRATGYGGYGGEILRKGAKLLTLDLASGGFAFQTVFSDATDWGAVHFAKQDRLLGRDGLGSSPLRETG